MTKHTGLCLKTRGVSLWQRTTLVLLALFLVLPLMAAPVSAEDNPKVKESMQTLKAELEKLGAPKLDGEDLYFGKTKVNGDFTVVDAVKAKHEGTATLFAKKGTNFVRVSTNVMKEGKRAVGSVLDPSGPAYAAINQGKAFYGLVDILGKTFDTGYEPIKSESGDIIGIAYVGYLME
jgi:hypothetical protein